MSGCADCEVKCEKSKTRYYQKFVNTQCEYYPCHTFKEINCLFCFCPLYNYKDCGGDFIILKNNIKDCSKCNLPHIREGYEYIINYLKSIRLEYI